MGNVAKDLHGSGARSGAWRVWGVWDAVAAFLLVFFSTVGFMYYLGGGGRAVTWPWNALSLFALVSAAVVAAWVFLMSESRWQIPDGVATGLLSVILGVAVGVFAFWYPRYSPGSDSADALEVGVRQLLHGHNPLGALTKLGHTLSPLLGGYLLAAPFVVLLGSVLLRGLFWLYVGVGYLVRAAGPRAALMFASLAVATPLIRAMLPSQNDHFVIAIELALLGSVGYFLCYRGRPSRWATVGYWASAALFGMALADRVVYWIVVIPLAAAFARLPRRRDAVIWLATSVGVTACLVLVLLVANPTAFVAGPLGMALDKIVSTHIPHSGLIVALVATTLACLLSWRVRTLAGAFGVASLSLATVFFLGGLVKALAVGWNLAFLQSATAAPAVVYNGSWLVFGLFALALPTSRTSQLPPPG